MRTLAALVALALAAPVAAGVGCRPPGYPEGAQVVIVADDMVFNNVPMAAWELRWREPPERLRAYYRAEWEARNQRVSESTVGEWVTVGTLDGQCFYTVQTRAAAGGGSYALLGVTRAPETAAAAAPGAGFPNLSGSRFANDIRHQDGRRHARTLLLMNSYSVEANASFYRNAMAGQGWQLALDKGGGAGLASMRAMSWKRGAEEATLTIAAGELGTVVTANIVDAP
ncbi:MAG TPA: hypothetical protein VF816_12965 [Rhodocyclaceae bacterium]